MAQIDIWLTCSPLTLHHFSLKVSQTWHNPSEIQGYMIVFSSDTCYKFLQQIANLVQKWWSVLHWQTRLNLGSSAYFCLLLHWTRSWCSLVSGSWSVTKSNNPEVKKTQINFWNALAIQNWKKDYLKRQTWVFVVTRQGGGCWRSKTVVFICNQYVETIAKEKWMTLLPSEGSTHWV